MNDETKPTTVKEMARLGGLARAKKLTKKRRIEIARKAGSTPRKPKKNQAEGE